MGVYRKIRFLSIEAEISTLDDFLALFMNRQIILSQKMEKKIFRRKQLATLSQRSPVKKILKVNASGTLLATTDLHIRL